MPVMQILATLFAAMLVVATPVAAHHRSGHEGGPPNGVGGQGNGNGNGGLGVEAHEECDGGEEHPYGQCVSEAVHDVQGELHAEKRGDDDDDDDDEDIEDQVDEFCEQEDVKNAGGDVENEIDELCDKEDVNQEDVDDFCDEEDVKDEDGDAKNEIDQLCD